MTDSQRICFGMLMRRIWIFAGIGVMLFSAFWNEERLRISVQFFTSMVAPM